MLHSPGLSKTLRGGAPGGSILPLKGRVRHSATSCREEAPGKTLDMLERVHLSAGLEAPQDAPEELDEESGEREVWARKSA